MTANRYAFSQGDLGRHEEGQLYELAGGYWGIKVEKATTAAEVLCDATLPLL
jgi:hypothetical protein